jgi:hypothetical protein
VLRPSGLAQAFHVVTRNSIRPSVGVSALWRPLWDGTSTARRTACDKWIVNGLAHSNGIASAAIGFRTVARVDRAASESCADRRRMPLLRSVEWTGKIR